MVKVAENEAQANAIISVNLETYLSHFILEKLSCFTLRTTLERHLFFPTSTETHDGESKNYRADRPQFTTNKPSDCTIFRHQNMLSRMYIARDSILQCAYIFSFIYRFNFYFFITYFSTFLAFSSNLYRILFRMSL